MEVPANRNLSTGRSRMRALLGGATLFSALGLSQTAEADSGVTHTDIAANRGTRIDYSRVPSPAWSRFQANAGRITVFAFSDMVSFPLRSRGSPGEDSK